jgi:hypothetical protein
MIRTSPNLFPLVSKDEPDDGILQLQTSGGAVLLRSGFGK